jgi:hypothetical protein
MSQRISLQWFNARSGVRIQMRHRDEFEHWTINGKEYSASTPVRIEMGKACRLVFVENLFISALA